MPRISFKHWLLHLVHAGMMLDPVTDTFNEPHLTLDSVESLDVAYLGSSIVPHLTLPHLQRLTLSGDITVAIEPFKALFSRSNCSVQQLIVITDNYMGKVKPSTLLSLFQLGSAITDLTLHLQDTAVHRVITSLSLPTTLPALARLAIDAYRERDDYDVLLDVLRARRVNGTLKTFSLTLRETRDDQSLKGPSPQPLQTALAGLRSLADGGLQCRIVLEGNPWPYVLIDTVAS
ncbi:hypothetical protein C8R47DRAFT_1227904 [Mycena vitilis]|nr:hypothetical protein C8R47DRAFT_1227904 [Mycena vitilis]